MSKSIRDFSGHLNYSAHALRLPVHDYADAFNITKAGKTSPPQNLVGNILVSETILQDGINKCIGAFSDEIRNRVIYFVYNSNGYHSILSYDLGANTISKILQSLTDSDVDVLRFNVLYKVKDVYIIHRIEDGDLLFFNDANANPMCLNIDHILDFGLVTEDLITLAKRPPLYPPLAVYGTDPTVSVNNFKKALFQFIQRWRFKDGRTSTWSPISKTNLPLNAFQLDIESDPTKNNIMNVTVYGGPADFQSIEIAMRQSNKNVYSDFVLVDTLDRDDYNISSGGNYVYKFANDGAYPDIDQAEVDLIADYVPEKANTMAVVNGNTIVLGGITEGYNNVPRSQVNVQITSELKPSNSSSNTPSVPKLTTVQGVSSGKYYLQINVGPEVAEGDTFNASFTVPVYRGDDFDVDVTYQALAGQSQSDVAQALVGLVNTAMVGHNALANFISPGTCNVVNGQIRPNAYAFSNVVTSTSSRTLKSGGQATWKWAAKFRLCLIYRNEFGQIVGIVSFITNADDPSDFSVTTPNFAIYNNPVSLADKQPMLPIIKASINHIVPNGAVSYSWGRTKNLSVSSMLEVVTAQVDLIDTNYIYFCIGNLDKYRVDNTGFIPSYDFQSGDRLRVLAKVDSATKNYTSDPFGQDYEILGVVDRQIGADPPVTNPVTPPTTGRFLKVAKTGAPAFTDNMLIEIYRPALRTNEDGQFFQEFGENYPTYVSNGVRYHKGQKQNQTDTQPATFIFEDGDVYYKFRNHYTKTLSPADVFQVGLMDSNYSDNWESAVNSNGRPFAIDPKSKKLYYPDLLRFSREFQQDTAINGTNRFFAENSVNVTREYGDIMKIMQRDNGLLVFQKNKIGRMGVYENILTDASGAVNVTITDKLLGDIRYYDKKYGVGTVPESIAEGAEGIYGWDNIRGVNWRLTRAGLDTISLQHNINEFAIAQSKLRGFDKKIYGFFSTKDNIYYSIFETVGASPAFNIAFNEITGGYESTVAILAEYMACVNTLLIAFSNGKLYTHNNPIFNRFFGVDYPSSITPVFNDESVLEKVFENITENTASVWDVPFADTNWQIVDDVNQNTVITTAQFTKKGTECRVSVPKAINSDGGVYEGQEMRGNWFRPTFRMSNAQKFVFLNAVIIETKLSL